MESIEGQVRLLFENLKVGDFQITSDRDLSYNCIAWAMGKADSFWWPDSDGAWPPGAERSVKVESFEAAFATEGFTRCDNGAPKIGMEKVALYTLNGKPTHAAFLLPTGLWASKLGRDHDVHHHTLECIGGTSERAYGAATHFFERPMPATSRPQMPNAQYEAAKRYDLTNEAMGLTARVPTKGAKAKPKKKR